MRKIHKGRGVEMKEKWKEIKGYEGKYWISNYGRLKNKEQIMKPMVSTNGYLIACLWKNNIQKKIVLHRLVAEAFIPNQNQYSDINHKDENKENNKIDNLEWCTHKYNMNYGSVKQKISEKAKGRTAWNKGKKCPEISARQLGKSHPHGSTKKKGSDM